jgi:F0F1-type ATP synthase epsilon subunit
MVIALLLVNNGFLENQVSTVSVLAVQLIKQTEVYLNYDKC